jgi:hypothetical protein
VLSHCTRAVPRVILVIKPADRIHAQMRIHTIPGGDGGGGGGGGGSTQCTSAMMIIEDNGEELDMVNPC